MTMSRAELLLRARAIGWLVVKTPGVVGIQ